LPDSCSRRAAVRVLPSDDDAVRASSAYLRALVSAAKRAQADRPATGWLCAKPSSAAWYALSPDLAQRRGPLDQVAVIAAAYGARVTKADQGVEGPDVT
jgi:hypothetical protein